MKKYIVLASILAFPMMTYASFDQNLKYGMSGSDVYQLQDILQENGCLTHQSTGYFGLLTLDAVKCYQTSKDIPSTGYVGIITRASLNTIVSTAIDTSTQAEVQETGTTTPIIPVSTYIPTFVPNPTQNNNQAVQGVPQPTVSVSIGTPVCSVDGGQSYDNTPMTIVGDYQAGRISLSSTKTWVDSSVAGPHDQMVDGIAMRNTVSNPLTGNNTLFGRISDNDMTAFPRVLPGSYDYTIKLYSAAENNNPSSPFLSNGGIDESSIVKTVTGHIDMPDCMGVNPSN